MTRKPTKEDKVLQYALENLMTKRHKGRTLVARCNRCKSLVLKPEVRGYSGQCMACDEDLSTIEWHYDDISTINKKEFEELLENIEAEIFT